MSYKVEFNETSPTAFGLYPLNYIAGLLNHNAFTDEGPTDKGYLLHSPAKFITHNAPSSLAGQSVYYVENKVYLNEDKFEHLFEPYETTVNGIADDMSNPIMRVQYKARITRGEKVVWTSRYAITPKKKLRRAEFLSICGLTIEEVIYKSRWTYNVTKTNPSTHINNISMDIEKISSTQVKSTFYINGDPANSINYKTLINSFGKTYSGYIHQYRLYNGPGINMGDNMYGSTLNVGIDPIKDSTINVIPGAINVYTATNKTLTFNPNLTESAELLAYMEFLPAQGKNENIGQILNLETGEEKLY